MNAVPAENTKEFLRLIEFLKDQELRSVNAVFRPLRPFFRVEMLDQLPLVSAGRIDRTSLKTTVNALTAGKFGRIRARRVVFISRSQPFTKEGWMTTEGDKIRLKASMEKGFSASLMASIGPNFQDVLWRSIGDGFDEGILGNLSIALHYALSKKYAVASWDGFGQTIRAGLHDSILYYLGYCLMGDRKMVQSLMTLLGFWRKCLILGFKADEPGTLLVIVK